MPPSRELYGGGGASSTRGRINACNVPEIPAFGQYYMYASEPKPSSMDRSAFSKKRIVDYHNMMWDPRIYRGVTYKTFATAESERCDRNYREVVKYRKKKTIKRVQDKDGGKFGGIYRPKTPPHSTSEKVGLEDMGVQTEKFLEEITDEVKEKEICTQTDQVFDMPIPHTFCPVKLGVDVACQVLPWELFSFDEEVEPIVTDVARKIIEQSLFEIMEELELDDLRAQQGAHEERLRIQIMRLLRLQEREQKWTDEKARLIAENVENCKIDVETEARVGCNMFTRQYLGGMGSDLFQKLRGQGLLSDTGLEETFMPWLHSRACGQYYKAQSMKCLLDDVIHNVVDTREAEVADGIWREIASENKPVQTADSEKGLVSEDVGE